MARDREYARALLYLGRRPNTHSAATRLSTSAAIGSPLKPVPKFKTSTVTEEWVEQMIAEGECLLDAANLNQVGRAVKRLMWSDHQVVSHQIHVG